MGGGGFDLISLGTAGALADDALANVTGVDRISLAAGGNAITLTNASFAVAMAKGALFRQGRVR